MIDQTITKYLKDILILEPEIVGDYYLGFRSVTFGRIRIEGGLLFDGGPIFSLCTGQADCLRHNIKFAYITKMQLNYKAGFNIFDSLRQVSKIRPVYNDLDFMRWFINFYDNDINIDNSFTIGFDNGSFSRFIECRNCGKRSYSTGDIENKYCSICKAYHTIKELT